MRADRLISLILLLQHRGRMTCAGLAHELEVSRRTVLRDIEALSYAGVPIVTRWGPGGGVSLRDEYRTSLTGLKDDEVRTILLSRDSALLKDLGWESSYRMSQLKLNASLPAASASQADITQRRLLIDSRWWWHQEQSEEVLGRLREAVFSDAVVDFEYEHYDGGADHVRAEAYALVAKSGLWYFIGKRDGEPRCYRVSRISTALSSGERFTRDPDFDVRQWWPMNARNFAKDFSSYKCVLSVPSAQLRQIQRMAPGRTRIIRSRGSRQIGKGRHAWVDLEVGVESEWYAQLIVMGLGSDFRIVSPKMLAASVAKRAHDVIGALGMASRPRARPR